MFRKTWSRLALPALVAAAALAAPAPAAHGESDPARDIVLVLDNSGSMRQNDPEFLGKRAVSGFIKEVTGDTRIAVLIFDEKVRLPVPLTEASARSREAVLKSLAGVDYRGKFTNTPAAIERAIYELKTNGRPGAEKSIILLTDGIVDTGNPSRDAESTRWLRRDLAADAAANGIRIFGVAFTDQADFQLIQSLARRTGAEYFRAYKPADLPGVFRRINAALATPPRLPPSPQAPSESSTPAPSSEAATAPATGAASTASTAAAGGAGTSPATEPSAPTETASTSSPVAPAPAVPQAPSPSPAPTSPAASSATGSGGGPGVAPSTAEKPAEPTPPASGAPASMAAAPSTTPAKSAASPAPAPATATATPGSASVSGAGSHAPAPAPPATASPAPAPPAVPARPHPTLAGWPTWMLGAGAAALVLMAAAVVILVRGRGSRAARSGTPTQRAPAFLVDLGSFTGQVRHDLPGDVLTVGRIKAPDVSDAQQIVIDKNTIGRRHAIIEYREHGYWVTDQNSLNGTFVNGQRISAATQLRHGDRLRFHDVEFEFGMPGMEDAEKTVFAGAAAADPDKTVLAPPDDAEAGASGGEPPAAAHPPTDEPRGTGVAATDVDVLEPAGAAHDPPATRDSAASPAAPDRDGTDEGDLFDFSDALSESEPAAPDSVADSAPASGDAGEAALGARPEQTDDAAEDLTLPSSRRK